MKYCLFFFATLLAIGTANAQKKSGEKEVLLIGVFHFNNPGHDLARTETFDVTSEPSQKELEIITDKIKAFAPDKIFVEWQYSKQDVLDTLYDLYKEGKYVEYVKRKHPKSAFYIQNEVFQLAFRAGKKAELRNILAIDYQMNWPYDSLLSSIQKAGQTDLRKAIDYEIKELGERDNTLRRTKSLTELLFEVNKSSARDANLGLYVTLLNRGGALHDFTGVEVVNAWYKRNLYMYSLIQKLTENSDSRIVVIVGAGHAAVLKHYIDMDEQFKVIELNDLFNAN